MTSARIYQKLTKQEVDELKAFKKLFKIKNKDLAKRWGVGELTVSNWLSGKKPTPKMLIECLDLFRLKNKLNNL